MATKENDILAKEAMAVCKSSIQAGAFACSLPILVLFGLPYLVIWRLKVSRNVDFSLVSDGLVYLLILVAGMIVYELIHGITWSLFSQNGLSSMNYGMKWRYLNPFCYYKEPLKVRTYIIGLLMPGILLGVVPLILALVNGSFLLFLFGVIFTFVAGGDFWLVGKLRNEPANKIVRDHPSEKGCYIERENKNPIINSQGFLRQE